MTLAALISDQAEFYGDKTAIFYQDQKISYAQLNETANRIANSLLERGLNQSENVGILLPNRPEFIQCFFGIIKAGGVAVMLNTGLKSDEIGYILKNSEAGRIITTSRYVQEIEKCKDSLENLKEVFVIDDEKVTEGYTFYDDLLFGDDTEPMVEILSEQPAGIIYTSGTTGSPKGAVLTHKNYFTNIRQIVNSTGMNHRTRMMCILPLFHVMGLTFNLLSPIYAGGSTVLMRGFSAREFLPAISKYKVSSFTAVPTVFAILNELPDRSKYDLSSLMLCISGAAPLDINTVRRFESLYSATIVEGYGLTEATCAVCINPVDGNRKVGSIGIPLPGVEMQIVDEENYEVDSLEIGEIIVRGDTVMQGYYNDEEATDQTLRNNWLYTGDLGFIDDEGYFFITGRKKEMIIRGGENIYPREIEQALIGDERIKDVAIVGVPDQIWGEEVLAYVVKANGATLSAQDVIDLAKSKLADYKCPRKVRFIPDLPKSVTGKIRKAILFKSFVTELDENGNKE